MKIISWNVNGLRACLKKGFLDFLESEDPDIICLQETKMQPEQLEITLPDYQIIMNSAVKKGYSGTAIFTKETPLSVSYHLNDDEHNLEGRAINLEFPDFVLVNVYTPNAQDKLARLPYRLSWDEAFRLHLKALEEKYQKPVITCGDFNVAHEEMDLKNPKPNRGRAGFSDEERASFTTLLQSGFKDVFRSLYPEEIAYTWWSYRFNARENNAGWRIDYFLVSDSFFPSIKDQIIYKDTLGSDHCPIGLIY